MKIYYIITFISIFFSILLAFLYRKHILRLYVLLQALDETSGILIWLILNKSGQSLWIPIDYLMIFSVFQLQFTDYAKIYLWGIFPILIVNYFSTTQIQQYFCIIAHCIILFLFFRILIKKIIHTEKLDLLYSALIISHVIVIINLISIIRDVKIGIEIYFAGIIADILIKIFLIIAKNGVSFNIKKLNKS